MALSVARLDAYLADPVLLIEECLVLPDGRTYGEALEPFQRAFFRAIFDKRADGLPQNRLVYDERRRGESKTEDAAAAGLAALLAGPPRHRSYAVAGDEDQAGLILDSIRGFKARSPVLEGIDVQKSVVRNTINGSELRVMSSDDRTAYGLRPYRVFFDELSLQTDERLWSAMWTAIGKSPHSQMVAVSMAGWDFASLGWRIRELARSSDRYYFASREGSELAPWLSAADMQEQRDTLHPADFARFWECRWTEPKGSWITHEMFQAAQRLESPVVSRRHDALHYGFVDVGLVHDATAIAVVHKHDDTVYLDDLATFRGTKNEPVRLDAVEDVVMELTRRFHVTKWRFEAPQAAASVQRLQGRLGCEVEIRYPTSETQASLFGNLYRLFAAKQLAVYPHEELKREALNLVTRVVGGRIKVVDSNAIHQDHVIAVGGAAQLVAEHRPAWGFIVEDDHGDPEDRGWMPISRMFPDN
jgi:hypothetical protein